MRAGLLLPSALVALSLLACGGGGGAVSSVRAEPESVEVTTVAAITAAMPTRISVVGTLVARRQALVAADANGVIVETRVERGQAVRKGDALVVVDTRTGRFSADASAAQAAAQRAQTEVADKECARAETLFSQGVISAAQVERTRAQCQAQRSMTEAARDSAAAANQVARAVVKAPFDGLIGERLVELGAFVGSASPVASVYASGPLRLKVAIPESEIGRVAVGSRVAVVLAAAEGAERRVEGVVSLVSGALREQTRDLVVEADLDAEDPELRPGMFVRAEVDVGETAAVVVPRAALRDEGTVHRLYTVKEGRAFEQIVRIGAEREGQVAVIAGVAAAEDVIVGPPADLQDGQRVNPAAAAGG